MYVLPTIIRNTKKVHLGMYNLVEQIYKRPFKRVRYGTLYYFVLFEDYFALYLRQFSLNLVNIKTNHKIN